MKKTFANRFGIEVDYGYQTNPESVAALLEKLYANAHKWGIGECKIIVNDIGVGHIDTDASYEEVKIVTEKVYVYCEETYFCGYLLDTDPSAVIEVGLTHEAIDRRFDGCEY